MEMWPGPKCRMSQISQHRSCGFRYYVCSALACTELSIKAVSGRQMGSWEAQLLWVMALTNVVPEGRTLLHLRHRGSGCSEWLKLHPLWKQAQQKHDWMTCQDTVTANLDSTGSHLGVWRPSQCFQEGSTLGDDSQPEWVAPSY